MSATEFSAVAAQLEHLHAEITQLRAAVEQKDERIWTLGLMVGGTQAGASSVDGAMLCAAAAAGDVSRLRAALHAYSPSALSSCDYDQRTALHLAACENQMAVVRFLIEEASLDVLSPSDRYGNTPLDDAMRCGHHDVAHFLRSHGAKSSTPGTPSETKQRRPSFTFTPSILTRSFSKEVHLNVVDTPAADAPSPSRRLPPVLQSGKSGSGWESFVVPEVSSEHSEKDEELSRHSASWESATIRNVPHGVTNDVTSSRSPAGARRKERRPSVPVFTPLPATVKSLPVKEVKGARTSAFLSDDEEHPPENVAPLTEANLAAMDHSQPPRQPRLRLRRAGNLTKLSKGGWTANWNRRARLSNAARTPHAGRSPPTLRSSGRNPPLAHPRARSWRRTLRWQAPLLSSARRSTTLTRTRSCSGLDTPSYSRSSRRASCARW